MNKVIPEVVGKDQEGKPANIDYAKLTSVLTKAVQQVWHEVQQLLARVSGLEKKVKEQDKQIQELNAKFQIPPDLVVKSQTVDIVEVI